MSSRLSGISKASQLEYASDDVRERRGERRAVWKAVDGEMATRAAMSATVVRNCIASVSI